MPNTNAAVAPPAGAETQAESKSAISSVDAETESSILSGDGSVTVEIAGRKYTWGEPNRRKRRKMLAALSPVITKAVSGEAVPAIQSLDDALDFFYEFHAGMAQDRDFLDERAFPREITTAFRAVREWLESDFRVGGMFGPNAETANAANNRPENPNDSPK